MMTALAIVSQVELKSNTYHVNLTCEQQTSCSGCASQKSCGTGVVSKAVGNKDLHWQLRTDKPVKVGQTVEIGLPEKNLIQSAAIVYLVPLFMLMLGAAVGQMILAPLWQGGEGSIIVISTLFAFLGVLLAKKIAKPLELRSAKQVVLIRVLGDAISLTP